MIYNFDEMIDRRSSNCLKWDTYDEDVLPLWVADMDFKSPQPVIAALHQRVEHGFFGYPDELRFVPHARDELRQAIVEWMATRHGWQIQPEWLVFVPGVVTGFHLAGRLARPEQAVLVQTPVYHPILSMAGAIGIHRQDHLLTRQPSGLYEIDWEQFEDCFSPETRLFLLCNPHNPIGKVFTTDELYRMAEFCLRSGVIIVSDEIHADLVFSESRHVPIASLSPEIAKHTITLMAPSKTFNLAGLQCSFAIISDPELRKMYIESRAGLVPWVNQFGLTGARAAYQSGGEWLDQLLVYLQANRDYLCEYVRTHLPGIEVTSPEATYLAWLDCRNAPIEGNPYKFFLNRARVALSDGESYGEGGQGFVRLNFGCPRQALEDALDRMRQVL